MATKHQKFTIEVPESWDADERRAFGDLVLEYIRERTARGEGMGKRDFPDYSKEYTESLDFKIAGKSKSRIDLTLSGDMLDAMDLLSTRKGKITYGFEKGSTENAKADGNIRGTYGQDSPNPKKARNFIGVDRRELELLVEKFERLNPESESAISKAARSAARAAARDVEEEESGE